METPKRVKITGDWMDAMGKALEKKPAPARPTKKRELQRPARSGPESRTKVVGSHCLGVVVCVRYILPDKVEVCLYFIYCEFHFIKSDRLP